MHSCMFCFSWLSLWLTLLIIIGLGMDAINKLIVFVDLVANRLEIFFDRIIAIPSEKGFALE